MKKLWKVVPEESWQKLLVKPQKNISEKSLREFPEKLRKKFPNAIPEVTPQRLSEGELR